MLTCLPLLCVAQPLCTLGHCRPCNTRGLARRVSCGGCCPGSAAHGGTISHDHPWEVLPDLCFCREPEEPEKEGQTAAKQAVTKEQFQGEGTIQLPRSQLRHLRSEAHGRPPCPSSTFRRSLVGGPTAQATEWQEQLLSSPKLFFRKLLLRMEIRLLENKISLKETINTSFNLTFREPLGSL